MTFTEVKNLDRLIPVNLIKKEWKDIPVNYESVYHATKAENLERISKEGMRVRSGVDTNLGQDSKVKTRMELRRITDEKIDQFANEMGYSIKRSDSFYCSPEVEEKWNKADMMLELKIDPNKVSVFDSDLATAVTISWLRTEEGKEWLENHLDFPPDGSRDEFLQRLNESEDYRGDYKDYAKQYWASGVDLDSYLELDDGQRKRKIKVSEILVPFKVDEKFIRVKK